MIDEQTIDAYVTQYERGETPIVAQIRAAARRVRPGDEIASSPLNRATYEWVWSRDRLQPPSVVWALYTILSGAGRLEAVQADWPEPTIYRVK